MADLRYEDLKSDSLMRGGELPRIQYKQFCTFALKLEWYCPDEPWLLLCNCPSWHYLTITYIALSLPDVKKATPLISPLLCATLQPFLSARGVETTFAIRVATAIRSVADWFAGTISLRVK